MSRQFLRDIFGTWVAVSIMTAVVFGIVMAERLVLSDKTWW